MVISVVANEYLIIAQPAGFLYGQIKEEVYMDPSDEISDKIKFIMSVSSMYDGRPDAEIYNSRKRLIVRELGGTTICFIETETAINL